MKRGLKSHCRHRYARMKLFWDGDGKLMRRGLAKCADCGKLLPELKVVVEGQDGQEQARLARTRGDGPCL